LVYEKTEYKISISPDGKIMVSKFRRMTNHGIVSKKDLLDAHLDADRIWTELIKKEYVDPNGVIQAKYSNLVLDKTFADEKERMYIESVLWQANKKSPRKIEMFK